MNTDKIVDKMYNEMLKRCGVDNCSEMMSEDTFDEDHINLLEEPKMTSECNPEQSVYGSGIRFERLRRVTGYISARGIDYMNNAKQAEVKDRITHDKYIRTESYYNEE